MIIVVVTHQLNIKANFVFRKASFSISTTRISYDRIIIGYEISAHKIVLELIIICYFISR
jgi:hypothetical protein